MTVEAATTILQNMIDGIDPVTGEVLPHDHLCNYPEVMRALHVAILSMSSEKGKIKDSSAQNHIKLNAGRPWTNQELDELEQLYLSGMPITSICEQLQRRERGLKKQLMYLGLIQSEAKPSSNPTPGLERAGLPWTREEDMKLRKLHSEEHTIAEISAEMHRSEYSIFCRMEKLELYGEEHGYPAKDTLPKWTSQDNRKLRELFQSGAPIKDIAANMERPEKSITARLFYMGLTQESPLPKLKRKQ